MKSFVISITIALVLGSFFVTAIDDLFVPGVRSDTGSRFKRTIAANGLTRTNGTCNSSTECCQAFYGPKCLDCQTLLTCADVVINKQSCSSLNAAKPFCVDNYCVATAPQNCDTSTKLRCTSEGFFPNPNNCERYFYCLQNATTKLFNSIDFDCPPTFVYDSATGMCKKRSTAADCKVISCTGNQNKYQVAAFDKSILIYCADTVEFKETLLFRCKDWQNSEWNLDTLQCRFVCKAEGRYPDVENCRSYYDCYKNGTALQFTKTSCPTGFKYDTNQNMCVFGTC